MRELRSRANQGVEEPVSPFDKTADSLSRGGGHDESPRRAHDTRGSLSRRHFH